MSPSDTSTSKVEVDTFRAVDLKTASFKVKIAMRKEEYVEGTEVIECED